MEGWIKIYRKLKEWEWYHNSNMVHLFIHILISANHKPKVWQGITIKKGQLITGLNSLNKDTGISIQTLRTCLKKLKKSQEITIKSTSKYSIITICNFDDYQVKETKANKQPNKQLTNNQQATNNKQECKEGKECKENILFNNFWEKFHTTTGKNKTDKDSSLGYWNKLKMDEKLKATENILNYYNSLNDKKYCKKARTYLSDKNFNDEFKNNDFDSNKMIY